jgi:tetratricopeptide (TPR) repeat protein
MRTFVARWILLGLVASFAALAIAFVWNKYQPALPALPAMNPVAQSNYAPPVMAAPGTGLSEPEDLFKIFASAPPIQPAQYETTELEKIFPQFQHQPFDQAGFDEVMLPFSYSDPNHLGNANEAMAFDALMSNDLDWSPGCYCARHAYFVFKRDRNRMQALRQGYTPELIATVIDYWKATHAIGGELVRVGDGYEGTLQIFDADGKQVFTRKYDQPHSFWDLLGAMDVDAMTFLDVAPSEEMAAYLREPRCEHPQSLIDLGSAAFMEEKSSEEFDTYEKILKSDPSFSMVRYWYANQKHWHDGDLRDYAQQNGLALSSRVEPSALAEFNPRYCPDADLAAQFPNWLSSAARLASENSAIVIQCRLWHDCYGSETSDAIVERGLKVAAKYPNADNLVSELALKSNDAWMSASLLTSTLLNHYMPGYVDDAAIQRNLAFYCSAVGREDIAMEMLSKGGPQQPQDNFYDLLESLTRAGRYSEAADMYQLLGPKFNPTLSKWMAPYAAFAAAVAGRKRLLDQILTDQHDVLAAEDLDKVFQAYRDTMDGKKVDTQQYLLLHRSLDFSLEWNMLLVAYGDANQGVSRNHRLLTECSFEWPIDRLIWIAQDDYQRRDPSFDAAAFYDYLGWMFGDDPWVAKAVADFHQRGGTEKPIDSAMLRADLEQGIHDGPYRTELGNLDWNHVLTSWRIAACVHQLLIQHKTQDAAEIAKLWKDYESVTPHSDAFKLACELQRKVSQSK